MDLAAALENLRRVCVQYRGTLRDHQVLQESLRVIQEALKAEPPKDEGDTPPENEEEP